MINLQNFFDQSVKSNLRTYDNMGKIATGQRDDLRLVVCQITTILKNSIKYQQQI